MNNFEVEKIVELSTGENMIYFKNSGKLTTTIEYNFNFEKVTCIFDVKDIDDNFILKKKEPILNVVKPIIEKAIPVKMDKNDQIIELLKEIRDLLKK